MKPGKIRNYSTLYSIGIEWDVTGDANHNATCTLRYRTKGTEEWREALQLFRIDYRGCYGESNADRPYNMLAGSVMFLEPGTEYEVELLLEDPDGVKEKRTIVVTTRKEPSLPTRDRKLFVVPGNRGGDGTKENPFRGLAEAEKKAKPGDIFILGAGDYATYKFTRSGSPDNYIVWKGDGQAVFSKVELSASYIWLEGITVKNKGNSWFGLGASRNAKGVVIKRNKFFGFNYSILLRRGCDDWFITDNTIVGDKQELDRSDIKGEGIELNHTSNQVVAYNRISRTADGISYPHRNCDIYGNDIRDVTDDGIEPDYGYANVRM